MILFNNVIDTYFTNISYYLCGYAHYFSSQKLKFLTKINFGYILKHNTRKYDKNTTPSFLKRKKNTF